MGVTSYLSAVTNGRGMAKSNLFAAYFVGGQMNQSWVTNQFGGISTTPTGQNITLVGQRILILCDEVTLPGVQRSTGNVVRYTGSSPLAYPTGLVYNDIQLSFMCDAEMQAVDFLRQWMEKQYQTTGSSVNRSYRFNYIDEFSCEKLVIEKRERNATDEIGLTAAKYELYRAWPYSLDAIPLSYGSSQLVKVTANFYYTNWDATFYRLPTI